MRIIEILMRTICFCMGLVLAFCGRLQTKDAGAVEMLVNTLFILVWLSAVVVLLVLPWALPLRNK